MRAKPCQSILKPSARRSRRSRSSTSGSTTSHCTRASEMRPIGTLMKKIQRQEELSVIQPPIVGPTVGATMTAMPYSANACGRSSGGNVSASIACSLDGIPPPPLPFRRRDRRSARHPPPADPLQDADQQQRAEATGEAAEQRGEGEDRNAQHVEALAPDHVGEPAADRQNDSAGDEGGGDPPGALVDADRQAAGDVAQRHIGDRRIEHDHEGGDGDDDGDEPRTAIARGRAALAASVVPLIVHRTLTVGTTDMPGPSRMSGCSSKTILTGTRWTILT